MKVGKNKLKGFIIVLLFFALGCGADSYDTNREEFADSVLDKIAPVAIVIADIIKKYRHCRGTEHRERHSLPSQHHCHGQ